MTNRIFFGLLLVALGVMFLLDTTGLAGDEADVFGTYWPALLVGWGLWGLLRSGFRFRLGSIILLVVGVVFLLSNLDIWAWDAGQLWPLLLVLFGLAIIGSFGSSKRWFGRSRKRAAPVQEGQARVRSEIGRSYLFSGGKERVTSQEYRGGSVSAICGGLELDLREARLGGDQAILDVTVVCGGVEILVPPDWVVQLQPSVVLGGAESQRKQPSIQDAQGELVVTGTVVCGGIEVK